MRKAIALLAALVALPSFGAVDTTTISGKVLTPSGDPATAGKVTCELSQAASASDGSGVQRVATRVSATIGATGAVSIAIAPNDTLTPAGTYYTCKFTVTTPASASWVEKWSVASAPDPVDLGSVSRLDVAPGTTTGVYVVALATCSGACPNGGVCIDKDDASTFYCYAGSWTRQDMPPCSPDPPTGVCTDGRLCQATATGFAIYGCYAGDWAAVTGGGGATVAVDGVAVTNSDWVDDGDIDFADAGAGRITGTVQANKVALSTDTTGDYVSDAAVNGGLVKVGTEGATLGLIDCAAGQVLKRNTGDTLWECGTDNTATAGTVSIDGAPNVPATGQVGIWTDTSEQGGDEELTYSTATDRLTAANLTVTNTIVGNIDTASALFANGANCSAGNYPLGVTAAGAVETCTADDDSPDSDAEVPDAITVSSSGSVAWTALTSYPAACSAGQYVSTIGDTLTCGTPSMSTATTLDADADGTANVTADADSVDFSLDGTGTVARVASDGSYVQVGTTTDGTRGATFQNNTSAGTPAEPAAPSSGYTLLYAFGTGPAGELYKKNNTDATSERLLLTSGNLAGDVTADATGNVTIADNAVQESDIDFDNTASTGQCATKSATSEKFTWAACGSGSGPTTDDAVLVGNGSTSDSKVIPDCDTGTLNYDTTTNAFSCGTDDTGGTATNPWDEVKWFEDFRSPGEVVDALGSSNFNCTLQGIDDSPSGTPMYFLVKSDGTVDSTTAGTGVIGGCKVENNTAEDGAGGTIGFGGSSRDMSANVFAFSKLGEFRSRIVFSGSNWATATTRNLAVIVGGLSQSSVGTTVSRAVLDYGAFFLCAPTLDLDDDGTADDGAEDNEWMFVVSNDGDGTADLCYGSGAGACTTDTDVTWYDTNIDCAGSGRNGVVYEFDITYDGANVVGRLDDNDDTAAWTWESSTSNCVAGSGCLTADIPSAQYVSLWGLAEETTSATTPSLPITIDWFYYKGIR